MNILDSCFGNRGVCGEALREVVLIGVDRLALVLEFDRVTHFVVKVVVKYRSHAIDTS